MLRTAFACAVLLLGAGLGAGWLTHGFQVWTAEGARRLEVLQRPIDVPAVPVQGPGVAARDLHDLLAGGQQVTIVDFIYTHCESLCLSLGNTYQQMQAALQATGKDTGVRLLSVSFDPQRDTVEQLLSHAKRMKADPAVWRFVRVPGEPELQRVLDRFQVVIVPDGRGDFQHNAALLVVDAQGRLVRIFDIAEQQLALDYARHLAAGGEL
ncbi:SCO family protein [Ramlibacter tataouinensis]|uniref:SCO family protein n=1 Tax=Ramlibacter tataouinensis TaxID=94132 RepID=UPI0022F38FF4|nr:SCO family protein [Ramlibacter tataouinensis]WBY03821.1 SCO family protein [Ramlibacter tataouinensis]